MKSQIKFIIIISLVFIVFIVLTLLFSKWMGWGANINVDSYLSKIEDCKIWGNDEVGNAKIVFDIEKNDNEFYLYTEGKLLKVSLLKEDSKKEIDLNEYKKVRFIELDSLILVVSGNNEILYISKDEFKIISSFKTDKNILYNNYVFKQNKIIFYNKLFLGGFPLDIFKVKATLYDVDSMKIIANTKFAEVENIIQAEISENYFIYQSRRYDFYVRSLENFELIRSYKWNEMTENSEFKVLGDIVFVPYKYGVDKKIKVFDLNKQNQLRANIPTRMLLHLDEEDNTIYAQNKGILKYSIEKDEIIWIASSNYRRFIVESNLSYIFAFDESTLEIIDKYSGKTINTITFKDQISKVRETQKYFIIENTNNSLLIYDKKINDIIWKQENIFNLEFKDWYLVNNDLLFQTKANEIYIISFVSVKE